MTMLVIIVMYSRAFNNLVDPLLMHPLYELCTNLKKKLALYASFPPLYIILNNWIFEKSYFDLDESQKKNYYVKTFFN